MLMNLNRPGGSVSSSDFLYAFYECEPYPSQVALFDTSGNGRDLSDSPPAGLCISSGSITLPQGGSGTVPTVDNPNKRSNYRPSHDVLPMTITGITLSIWYQYGITNSDFTPLIHYGDVAAAGGNNSFGLFHDGSRFVQNQININGSGSAVSHVGGVQSAGIWYHAVGVWADIGGRVTQGIYLNGANLGTGLAFGTFSLTGTERISIGGRYNGGADDTAQRAGLFYRASIITRELNASEVSALYNGGTPLDVNATRAIANP